MNRSSPPRPRSHARAAATRLSPRARTALAWLGTALALATATTAPAHAQAPEGGLYIAGYGFDFVRAARQALAKNPPGQRFFVVALPPNTGALTTRASRAEATARDRVVAGGGVLLVCQRDVDRGAVRPADLVPGVVVVRGFPPPGGADIPPGERYFPGEDGSRLPQSNTALRRLRSTCS